MVSRLQLAVVIILLACVVFVFVSPAINLPYTTVQNSRQAVGQFAMLMIATACAGILLARMRLALAHPFRWEPILVGDSLIDVTCTRRC